jgi:hypothetical protein
LIWYYNPKLAIQYQSKGGIPGISKGTPKTRTMHPRKKMRGRKN